jgi:cell division protein FtsI (penicillin-binding protein 3)
VPDVRGMGLSDAVYVLEKRGLKVSSKGYGKVVTQSIIPGTKAMHQQIQITLR